MRSKLSLALAVVGLVALGVTALGAGKDKLEAKEWVIATRPVGKALRGSPVKLEVELTSRAGFHLNDDYPLNFKAKPSAAAKFAKARIDREDGMSFEPCRDDATHRCFARIPVTLTPNALGAIEAEGTLAFSVCNPEVCLIKKVDLSVPVQVSEK